MTREDVIRMAREAGALQDGLYFDIDVHSLERFATLVAAAEREALVQECVDIVAFHGGSVEIEAAIRARGEKQ